MKKSMLFMSALMAGTVLALTSCGKSTTTTSDVTPEVTMTEIITTTEATKTTTVEKTTTTSTQDPADIIDWSEEVLGDPQVDPTDDNYRVFYEIFPISYSDSDGDGNGDLQGIINRLDYLNDGDMNSGKSLGIQGIWLTPIFKSPTYHKYDATSYYDIDPVFGDLDTFKTLIEECHKRNIKLIMDLAINHTSTDNEWFKSFCKAHAAGDTESKYYDWYDWYTTPRTGHGTCGITGASGYCEANFASSMPELNFDNPEVYTEMVNVAKYWIDQGVDGFRFDAAKYIYYLDTEKNVEFWDKYIADIKTYASETYDEDLYTVAEVWDADDNAVQYNSSVNTFAFSTSQTDGFIKKAACGGNATTYTNYVENYIAKIKSYNENALFCPFISNHDMDRSSGYLKITGQAQMAANLYILCSGSPFIYYGEEIGAKGSRGGAPTDANRRLKMRWGDGDTVNDPEGSTYKEKNQINGTVASQINSKSSLLTYYRHLIQLRNKYPEIARGTYDSQDTPNSLGLVKITYNDIVTGLVHNTTEGALTIDLADYGFTTIADYIGMNDCSLEGTILTVGAQTSVILK